MIDVLHRHPYCTIAGIHGETEKFCCGFVGQHPIPEYFGVLTPSSMKKLT
ncbi:Uncharacterized protein APZ42_024223 [Daphnia magna]|uniref:Uncharacterized protein n=1 Tax=Daphnia magna TaxID=35525 RepID=A0A164UJV9_9CRUS|nr:Uncharacterized protein APZ42_024223 [Daphnia magna]